MDTKHAEPIIVQNSLMPKGKRFLPTSLPKTVFLILSVIIALELVWGAYYLLRPSQVDRSTSSAQALEPVEKSATIRLISSKIKFNVGENVVVDVVVEGNSRVVGVDLSLNYDPKVLSLEPSGFSRGSLFSEYLGAVVDKQKGMFTVSGVSDPGVNLDGGKKFGTLTFKALGKGNAMLNIEFKEDVTTDSNVIDGRSSRDILGNVGNLKISVR